MQTIEIIEGVTLTATEETLSWWEGQSEEEGNWEDQHGENTGKGIELREGADGGALQRMS